MSGARERIESLHQRASTQYLQGEYGAAIATWRELLQIDPDDERAREGMRLCHMLAAAEPPTEADSTTERRPEPERPEAMTAIGFGLGEELDRSLDRIDEVLKPSTGSGTDWMDTPHRPVSGEIPVEEAPQLEIEAPGLDRQATVDEGPPATDGADEKAPLFDLSLAEEPHVDRPPEGSPANADPEPLPSFDLKIDPAMLGIEEGSPGDLEDASLSPTEAAAAELKHRTNELMAEAMHCYERGERQEALAVLGRLAILDEENEAARTFAEHIRAELDVAPTEPSASTESFVPTPSATGREATPPPATAVDYGESIDLPTGEALEVSQREPARDPIAAVLDEVPVSELSDRELGRLEAEVAVQRAPRRPSPLVLAAAAVAGVAFVAFVGLRLFGGDGGSSAAPPEPPAPPAATAGAPAGGETGEARAPVDSGAPPATVLTGADLPRVLQKGREALDRQDYAASILAFNEALQIEPGNAEARDRLAEAVELYRAEKERLADRTAALEAFRAGDYRNALRLFYRLTPDGEEDRQQIARYMRDGWYNLAVRALSSGECKSAREHLNEVRQLDPKDPDLDVASGLADQCARSRPDWYYQEVAGLSLRGLGD